MICKSCCKQKHRKCEDNDPKTGQQRTDYRGCCCAHKTAHFTHVTCCGGPLISTVNARKVAT